MDAKGTTLYGSSADAHFGSAVALSGDSTVLFIGAEGGDYSEAYYFDETAPTLSSSPPADDSTEIATTSDIVFNFSEAVDVKTGNINIKKSSDDSTVETIDVTSELVTGSGTTSITINPATDLEESTQYYVQVEATALEDSYGNSFAGITDKTTLSFTTLDATNPTLDLASTTPTDNQIEVALNSDIVLAFSEAVDLGDR